MSSAYLSMSNDTHYDLIILEINGYEYAVAFNEAEARESAKQDIREMVWAFNAEFLSSYLPLSPSDIDRLRGHQAEDVNEPLFNLIHQLGRWDEFVNDAIDCDGVAHFLATYDDQEYNLQDILLEHHDPEIENDYDVLREEVIELLRDQLPDEQRDCLEVDDLMFFIIA